MAKHDAEDAHALFSPSSGHKWLRCTGSLAMEDGLPNTTNDAAEEGTAAHELAAVTLTDGNYLCAAYEGRIFNKEWEATEEMCEYTQIYVDAIRARVDEYYTAGAVDVHLFVENRVDLSDVLGIPEQFGTSDAIFLVEWPNGEWLISVEDLKYGYRLVNAEDNEQLMLYALAALDQYRTVGNFTRARMVIHQPRREHVSDWEISVEDLLAFGATAKLRAHAAHALIGKPKGSLLPHLTPGDKQCTYCKAAGSCPALGKFVEDQVGADFEDLTKESVESPPPVTYSGEDYARDLAALPLVELWCKRKLAAAESFIFAGGEIPGWKIVAGKKGRRTWTDKKEAEQVLTSFRLRHEEMYDYKLISPTTAEKLLAKASPRRWKKLINFITQKEGQPSMAEIGDKREPLALTKPEDDFDMVTDGNDMV